MAARPIHIDPLSARSIAIETSLGGNALMNATGFLVERAGTHFLVTNWHVVSGRNPDTQQPLHPSAAVPDRVAIRYHARGHLGTRVIGTEMLHANGAARWREHTRGHNIDVVALPLNAVPAAAELYTVDLQLAHANSLPHVTMPVAIIGFPFGLAAGGVWPIWKIGHIATDPDIDYDGRPAFVIDATTRSGMSGSLVVARVTGGYNDAQGNYIMTGGVATKMLGVYSGRIHGEAELGLVWRPTVLDAILP